MGVILFALFLAAGLNCLAEAPNAAASPDPLGRDNPRSAVTRFLLACHNEDYQRAANYLDLRHLSAKNRDAQGPALARELEAILNSSADFNVLHLSQDAEGDHFDIADPATQPVATILRNGQRGTLDLSRVALKSGMPPVWLFSSDTVAAIPQLTPSAAPPAIAHYLPPLLVQAAVLETPLWKWLTVALAVMILVALGSLFDRVLGYCITIAGKRLTLKGHIPIAEIAIIPARVVFSLAVFRAALQFIDVSAIARLYIDRTLAVILVSAITYFLIKFVELLLSRVEASLSARQQYASRSMLHLLRRAANVTIVVLAFLLILSNWGYNTTTLVAGLGVGGIAVALAAQQTIANVFAGVSVIGDQPVRIGDFGKFGDLTGVVEDIGMRSTRIRTFARTVVTVPNSSFAGLNIENYSVRDKMLFETTLAIKRSTPEEQVQQLMEALKRKLESHKSIEAGQSIVRITSLTSAAVNIKVFCYVLTSDRDRFYSIQGELLLGINEVLKSASVDLA
jgi:MscS family membrane protein